jgi:hypothetical protein
MKKKIILTILLLSSIVEASIVVSENKFFVESKGKRIPIFKLNNLTSRGEISQLKVFAKGKINVVAFALKDQKERIYSVDEDGFIYLIAPFANYELKRVVANEKIEFKQQPGKYYSISSKGLFIPSIFP